MTPGDKWLVTVPPDLGYGFKDGRGPGPGGSTLIFEMELVAIKEPSSVPFFGPTRRADGVFQLYLPLPYQHIVEVDSTVYDAARTGVAPRDWRTQ